MIPRTSSSSRWDLLALAAIALSTGAVFWRLLFTDEFTLLASYDNAAQYYPSYRYAASVLREGTLPLWDPYTFSGRPLVGDLESGLFYPLHLLLFLLAPSPLSVRALEIFTIVGHFLAATFIYFLSRSLGTSPFGALVSAVIFSFGGIIGALSAHQVGVFQAMIWLPLVFLCFHRSLVAALGSSRFLWAMASGLTLGLSLLAGHFQPPFFIALALGAFGLAWCFFPPDGEAIGLLTRGGRLLGCLLLTATTAFAFSAVQLFPAIEFGQFALRWLGPGEPLPVGVRLPYSVSGQGYALAPRALAALIFPVTLSPEEISPYFGVLPFGLMLYGISRGEPRYYVRFFSLLLIGAFVYSLGSFSLLHGLGYALVPFLEKARVPSRGLYLFHFAAALLAGFGAHGLALAMDPEIRERYRSFMRWLTGGAVMFVGLAIGGVVLKKILQGTLGLSDDELLFSALLIILALGLLWIRRWAATDHPTFQAAVVILILLDLAYFGVGKGILPRSQFDRIRNFSPAELYRPSEVVDFLASRSGLYRVDVREDALPPNIGALYGFSTMWGYASVVYRDYYEFLWRDLRPGSRIQNLLGARYVVARTGTLDLPLVWDREIRVYENPEAFPRAWIVHEAEVIPDRRQAIDRLLSPDFDPRRSGVLDRPPAFVLRPAGLDQAERVEITHYGPTRISARARLKRPGLLVLGEVDYPGWHVTVNGRPSDVYRANGLLRATVLDAGESHVTFEYRPRSFRFGLFISTLTAAIFLISIGLALWQRLRQRRIPGVLE